MKKRADFTSCKTSLSLMPQGFRQSAAPNHRWTFLTSEVDISNMKSGHYVHMRWTSGTSEVGKRYMKSGHF